MQYLKDVYIVDYIRSAFSRSRPNEPERDVFNTVRMDEVLSRLISHSVSSNSINAAEIGDVIIGCAYQRDENWTFGGRHPVFLSHLPAEVPSAAIDRACSSSLNATAIGAMEIMTGMTGIVLAGGMEHMTHVPRLSNRLCEPLLEDASYSSYRMDIGYHMGLTAEKLARERDIGRAEMDEYALRSHMRATKALESGFLRGEILPISVGGPDSGMIVERDQSIRPDTTAEKLAALPPAFMKDGLITAGNSSPLNAGASLVTLMSGDRMEELGLKPLAKLLSVGWASGDPSIMGAMVVPAIRKALANASISVADVDIWEINEAFSVVVLNAIRELGIDSETVNVNGGAIAIGHPLGASGARLAGTLSRMLQAGKGDYGVAAVCVGGGQGYAVVLQRV
jgi:acetyl-CoA acetyltransferase family protein